MQPIVQNLSCSSSTTATNSQNWEKHHQDTQRFDGEVMCDWLSFRHDFDIANQTSAIDSGRTLKISQDGEIEWEKTDFTQIRCPSSDTSIRLKCDGAHLWFQGNIGRFQQQDNIQGLTVLQCFEKAAEIIKHLHPELDLRMLGTINRRGTAAEYGTYLTRIDLTSNFHTDSYSNLAQQLATRRIGQKLPRLGKYGPTWGYDSKRGQFWKAKLYDKQAEQDGKRTPYTNETLARFEIQLGATYLRKYELNLLQNWGNDMDTENIIYGKFANQVFREQATIDTWSEMPSLIRQHAILWRDGTDPRSYLSKSSYYRVRSALLEYGLDISSPCNIMTLTQRIKTVTLTHAPTLRKAA